MGSLFNGVHHEQLFVNLLSMMQPTAELLVQLPGRIAERWKSRKDRIAAEKDRLTKALADHDALNQKAVTATIKGKISAEEFSAFKDAGTEEKRRIEDALSALDSEKNTMEEMLKQAELQAVDLVGAWEKGNTNQRQELARAFFPEGLVFSHQLKFFEPANTLITDMIMRFLGYAG